MHTILQNNTLLRRQSIVNQRSALKPLIIALVPALRWVILSILLPLWSKFFHQEINYIYNYKGHPFVLETNL